MLLDYNATGTKCHRTKCHWGYISPISLVGGPNKFIDVAWIVCIHKCANFAVVKLFENFNTLITDHWAYFTHQRQAPNNSAAFSCDGVVCSPKSAAFFHVFDPCLCVCRPLMGGQLSCSTRRITGQYLIHTSTASAAQLISFFVECNLLAKISGAERRRNYSSVNV